MEQIRDPEIKNHPDCFDLEARALMLEGEKEKALAAVHRAILAAPKNYRYLMTEGQIYQNFDDQKAAVHSFLLADTLRPHCADTIYSLGVSFFILGTEYNDTSYYGRAERHFREALELDPKYDRAEFMLGALSEFSWHLDQAREHFERAIAMKPQNPFYHLHYGVLLERLGDAPAALQQLQLAEREFPAYARTHVKLGELYRELRQFEAAKRELEEAVRLNPDLPEAHYQLGSVYRHLGMKAKSEEEIRKFKQTKMLPNRDGTNPVESTLSRSQVESGADHP